MTAVAASPSPLPQRGEVTKLLKELKEGHPGAADRLAPIIYEELRRLASRQLRAEKKAHTLQTTALVHEACIKLVGGAPNDFNNRAHFFVIASQAMRQILVDSARSRLAQKRGGGAEMVELTEGLAISEQGLHTALIVSEALSKLERLDPRQARIVEMRFYVGLEVEEIASVLGISRRTVIREWKTAQAWLYSELRSIR